MPTYVFVLGAAKISYLQILKRRNLLCEGLMLEKNCNFKKSYMLKKSGLLWTHLILFIKL